MSLDRGGRVNKGVCALGKEGEGFMYLCSDKSPKQFFGPKNNKRILFKINHDSGLLLVY